MSNSNIIHQFFVCKIEIPKMLKGNILKMWFYLNLEQYLPHAADVTCDDCAETSAVLRSKNKMGLWEQQALSERS